MDPAHQIAKRQMHCTMPRQPRHAGKSRGADCNVKMALTALAVPGMTTMLLAFVADLQRFWGKSRSQPVMNLIGNSHFTLSTPVVRHKNP